VESFDYTIAISSASPCHDARKMCVAGNACRDLSSARSKRPERERERERAVRTEDLNRSEIDRESCFSGLRDRVLLDVARMLKEARATWKQRGSNVEAT